MIIVQKVGQMLDLDDDFKVDVVCLKNKENSVYRRKGERV